MARSHVGEESPEPETISMLDILEHIGRQLQPLELNRLVNSLPEELVLDRERLTRFLLLVSFLDQQAESPTARRTAIDIHRAFGDDLFSNPVNCLLKINDLVSLKGNYKVSPAIGRVLPRFGWFVLRVGGFLVYEMMLNRMRLSDRLGQCRTPREAVNFLHSNHLVESILRNKAARMYISWVGHPDLGIDVSGGRWDRSLFEMPVDGHVGKIFSRTGMVAEVIHERKKGKTPRWNIIFASQMRPMIQSLVGGLGRDCVMVDHGAFQVGYHCCPDNLEGMGCDDCPRKYFCRIRERIGCRGYCLLADHCRRNLVWRAY